MSKKSKKRRVPKEIREYFSNLGKKGGKKSKRELTSEQARNTIKKRWDKRKE